jgi:energy-coupling factor transporter ATP-binding protein EcfA2
MGSPAYFRQDQIVTEHEVIQAFLNDPRFGFKESGEFLRGGRCPNCNGKDAWVGKDHPWVVKCNRINNCGWSETARQLYPDLFTRYAEKFPATPEKPNATADAYLKFNRGFDLVRMDGWYSQERYRIQDTGEYVETVRVYLDEGRTRYWERLIDKDKKHGQRVNFGGRRKEDGSVCRGDWWMPPGQTIGQLDEVYLVEGIFHAMAFHQAGYKACALLMAGNFPETAIAEHTGRQVRWRLALDDDPAGRKAMLKMKGRLKELGEKCSLALTGMEGRDWDDLYRLGKLNDEFLGDCLWRGRMFAAEDAIEKAWAYYAWKRRTRMLIEFDDALYSVVVGDKLNEELAASGLAIVHGDSKELFRSHVQRNKISPCYPQFQYCERNQLTGELFYFFHVTFANHTSATHIALKGGDFESAAALNKALLVNLAGATFTGSAADLKILRDDIWFKRKALHVTAVPFVGYDRGSRVYVFQSFAFQHGRLIEPNKHGFFVADGDYPVKTTFKGFPIHRAKPEEFDTGWFGDFCQVFGQNGIAALVFFFGSLFAEQIRAEVKSFPFLEITGEPGSGKSTLLEFLWKLLGRDDYEGFDPSKATFAARARAFMQVANLPIVLIESDRGAVAGDAKKKMFDFEELKTAYNGRAIRSLGVMNRGNDIEEPPFRGTIVISQNADVDGTEALLSRLIQLHTDCKHHTEHTKQLAPWFETATVEQLGGFLQRALARETEILACWREHYPVYLAGYGQRGDVKFQRILKNHASLMGLAHALQLVIPEFTDAQLDRLSDFIYARAVDRQQKLNADHPIVQGFWESYELLNVYDARDPDAHYAERTLEKERLNHANEQGLIAINLKQFYQCCMEQKVEATPTDLLKRYLPNSKKFKYLGQRTVRSKLLNKGIWCWLFQEPRGKQ